MPHPQQQARTVGSEWLQISPTCQAPPNPHPVGFPRSVCQFLGGTSPPETPFSPTPLHRVPPRVVPWASFDALSCQISPALRSRAWSLGPTQAPPTSPHQVLGHTPKAQTEGCGVAAGTPTPTDSATVTAAQSPTATATQTPVGLRLQRAGGISSDHQPQQARSTATPVSMCIRSPGVCVFLPIGIPNFQRAWLRPAEFQRPGGCGWLRMQHQGRHAHCGLEPSPSPRLTGRQGAVGRGGG